MPSGDKGEGTFAPTDPVSRGQNIVPMERAIEATTTVSAAHARAREILMDDPGAVLCETCSAEDRRARRFLAQLAVDIGGGASVHQEVEIRLGAPGPDAGLTLPLTWRATGHAALYPTFEGVLAASPHRVGTRLTLTGRYRLPLGAFGRFGDAVAGHKLASASLTAFLDGVARRLEDEVDRRIGSVPKHRAPTRSRSPIVWSRRTTSASRRQVEWR